MDHPKPLLLLLDPRNDRHYTGTNRAELLDATGAVRIDIATRRAVIFSTPDTVSFSADHSDDELIVEANRRALDVLCRLHGFILFVQKD